MSDEAKSKIQEIAWSVAAAILSALVLNGAGLYVQHRINQRDIETLQTSYNDLQGMVERNKAESDATRQRLTDQLYDIQRDVSYIRGTLEKR